MNERRRFLRLVGGVVAVCGAGCGAHSGEPSGAGGAPPGATSTGGGAAGGTASSSTATTLSGAGGTCGVGGASGSGKNADPCHTNAGVFDVGKPADYPDSGLHAVQNDEANVLVGRDGGGLYAMSALCTHLCCDLDKSTYAKITSSGVRCLCHGSQFDALGNVVTGPATMPLAHHPLTLGCDGILYVDTTEVVAGTTRLVVA